MKEVPMEFVDIWGKRIGRAYATQKAAMDCASLARKAGYKGVEVHPIIKKAQIAKAGK
jgi:hypothetical protein